MHLFHNYHRNKIQDIIHSDFWLFEFSIWLHTFSRSLIAVFIPIFLLQINYTVTDVLLFYFLYYTLNIPLNFVARFTASRIGARITIVIASLFSVTSFVGLFSLGPNNWILLVFIAICFAIYDTFYWIGHPYLFMKCSKNDDNISGDTSKLEMTRRFAGMLAPMGGALILIFFSRNVLIVISIILLLLSVIPLFKIKNLPDKPRGGIKKFKEFFDDWSIAKDYIIISFFGVHCKAEDIIWPLFIFLFFTNVESVAAIPVIVSLTAIIFTYWTGKVAKERRNTAVALGSIFIAALWIMRIIIDEGLFYYLSTFLVSIFAVFVGTPLDNCLYEKGKKKDALSAAMWRNLSYVISGFAFFGVLLIVINVFHFSFLFAASSLLCIVMVIHLIFRKTT